jgi:hypothetical protein
MLRLRTRIRKGPTLQGGVKGGISTDRLRAIHQTIRITKSINVTMVPPIIAAKCQFAFCVDAVDVSGEGAARVVDEIDEAEVLVEEDGSVVNGAEDNLEDNVLEEDVLEEDVLVDGRGTGIPDAISSATMGSKDG